MWPPCDHFSLAAGNCHFWWLEKVSCFTLPHGNPIRMFVLGDVWMGLAKRARDQLDAGSFPNCLLYSLSMLSRKPLLVPGGDGNYVT